MEYKKLPDLKGLATLRAVVELGGVEQAAQSLHVGQPAVTKRLRALEDCYGVALMQRKGRKLELTGAGDKVYAYARSALDQQRALIEDLRRLSRGQNQLRLEVTFAIGERLLPALLLGFAEQNPQFRVFSRMGYSRHIQTRVATGLADIGLLELEPDHPDIQVQRWLDDELILVAAPQHPLATQDPVRPDDLYRHSFVLREPESATRVTLDRALRHQGLPRLPTALEIGSTDAIVEILASGRHLSFLPRFAVTDALERGRLSHIALPDLPIGITLWMARNRNTLDNPVADRFVALLDTGSSEIVFPSTPTSKHTP